MKSDFVKILVYNYLYEFSLVESKIKDKFMEELEGCNSSKLQNKLLFLHLSAEIGSKFTEDISQNTIKINKLRYPIIVDKFSNYKLKWNLKKELNLLKIMIC